MHIFKSIHKGDTTLEDIEKEQIRLKRYFSHINQKNPKNKSDEQKKTVDNIKNIHDSREKVIQLFNDYARNMSKNVYKSKKGTGLKILTPNQMLKRLSIALAQINTDNNSESLLNEIRQIVYSLYRSKEIAKIVYNNIIKSIKV